MNYIEFLLTVLIALLVTSVVFFITLYISNAKRKEREKEKETKAELSYMREKIEREIYKLTEKLYTDQERWKNVNHLLLNNISDKYQLKISDNSFSFTFFKNMGINIESIQTKKDKVFFLTPFHNDFESEYGYVKNVCMKMGLSLSRGDENYIKGNILKYILIEILSSGVVIANLNGRNPNVYYELGIAHAIGKPVILITNEKSLQNIPFDLQSNRLIIYKDKDELKERLINALSRTYIE